MNLVVFFDHVFVRDAGGRHYTRQTFDSAFWMRYRTVFERVTVVSRVQPLDQPPAGATPAEAEGVTFAPLPAYSGPWQYARNLPRLMRCVREHLRADAAVILRVPSSVGTLAWKALRKLHPGRPFAVEVVADPAETLAVGAVKSLLRPIARRAQIRAMKAQCHDACAAAYVSRQLASVYPPASTERASFYSSIDLADEDILAAPRTNFAAARRLIHIGTMETRYKAQDVLLRALLQAGMNDLRVLLIGDGKNRASLEFLADSLGLSGRVTFAGRLPAGARIRAALDESDVFVLPSRTEGLPRAMIEAMARGLPCIGTAVGGIPELIGQDCLVPPDDVDALAARIREFVVDPARLARESARNVRVAADYRRAALDLRRRQFYERVAAATRARSDHPNPPR